MLWLLLSTGFSGGLTFWFVVRWLLRLVADAPSIAPFFSPKGGCAEAVVRELKKARKEILVQAYSFSSKPITAALLECKLRGVRMEIVLDKSNEKEDYSDMPQLMEQGIVPLIDSHHAIAHNKVMILDGRVLITGSFNFTDQAESHNAENLLIIKGHPELIQIYRKSFLAHKEHSRPATTTAAKGKAETPSKHKAA